MLERLGSLLLLLLPARSQQVSGSVDFCNPAFNNYVAVIDAFYTNFALNVTTNTDPLYKSGANCTITLVDGTGRGLLLQFDAFATESSESLQGSSASVLGKCMSTLTRFPFPPCTSQPMTFTRPRPAAACPL